MAEVAYRRTVEAVFDWKQYLRDNFGYETEDSEEEDD